MKRVLIQGAFEILNAGHVLSLKQCKAQGDYLIVALNTNELLAGYKKRQAVLPWSEKKIILEGIRYVDEVIAAPLFSPLNLLIEHDIQVYCLSREWVDTKAAEIEFMVEHNREIFFTTDFGLTHTSEIKKRLLAEQLASV